LDSDDLYARRQILITTLQELLDLADGYRYLYPQNKDTFEKHRYFTLEAARVGNRLLRIQKTIEENGLDKS
jgi:hypothetical protein